MLILGIESSCDDTSVALVDCSENGHVIISEVTASQIDIHQKYGGVVPEIAGRMHAEKIVPLIEAVLAESPLEGARRSGGGGVRSLRSGGHTPRPDVVGTTPSRGYSKRPDAIAVTAGPGLVTGLIVGVEAARTLSYAWNIPLVGVNHIEGHIHSVEISNDEYRMTNEKLKNNETMKQLSNRTIEQFPTLCLVVSGGHTELVLMRDHGKYEILGATKDDAAGECFDKVAKLLGLPYPGGPEISKLAETGRTDAIDFPRPMLKEKNFDFSFAGLKTSALYWLRDHSLSPLTKGGLRGVAVKRAAESAKDGKPLLASPWKGEEATPTINDFCASVEQAIVDVLVAKTLRAMEQYKPKTIILCGGVSANKKLRETLTTQIAAQSPLSNFQYPLSSYCMDNGAMIAVAGYYHAKKGDFIGWKDLSVDPNWKIQ